jgi:hypothetical protein
MEYNLISGRFYPIWTGSKRVMTHSTAEFEIKVS